MKKITYLLGTILLIFNYSYSQDIHFTSMDFAPLNLNPAMAGANKDLSINSAYRSQWSSVATPFNTIGADASMRINRNSNQSGDFAIGINFFNDNAGYNKMATNNFGLSLAYHLKLTDGHRLGLGIQGRYGNRALDLIDGMWGNQYDGEAYNPNLPSNEVFESSSFSYFDANVGLVYTFQSVNPPRENNGSTLNIGLAAFHVNRPFYSFIDHEDERLHIRLATFVSAEIGIGDSPHAIKPQLIAQFQGPQFTTLLGMDYRYFTSRKVRTTSQADPSIAFGFYWRNQDAIMTRFSVRFFNLDVGAAYDFNILNDLQRVSNAYGAFEINLRYMMDFAARGRRVMF